jgi:tRNA pseudouridine55 synthase
MSKIIPIWKPRGVSSYDVVRACKRRLRELEIKKPKIGHAGTLDPFAEGVILIMYGREATKKFDELQKLAKVYLATSRLGASSTTLDLTGVIVDQRFGESASRQVSKPAGPSFVLRQAQGFGRAQQLVSKIQEAIPMFTGEIEQAVPNYSAAKVNGKPRYTYAREGIAVPGKTKKVVIHQLNVLEVGESSVVLRSTVSSGTYIRQLSYDLFKSIGVESYLTTLVRESVGDFTKKDCTNYEEIALIEFES